MSKSPSIPSWIFAIGLSNAFLMAAVFAGVLWNVGGGIEFLGIRVPGYFVWVAAGYGLLASVLTLLVGRPLIDRTEQKNAAEAQNRFELVRVRENAESIALIGGEEDERGTIENTLSDVLKRWKAVITHQSRITFIIPREHDPRASDPATVGGTKIPVG